MAKASVVAFCVVVAILYGVAHDQVTIRLCNEYFTLAHPPPPFPISSPTLLATYWGVAATFWVGLLLGVFVAQASHSPGYPPVPFPVVARKVLAIPVAAAIFALLMATVAFVVTDAGLLELPEPWYTVLPPERHARFMAAWSAHITSYSVAFVGGSLLVYRLWNGRGRPALVRALPNTPLGILRMSVVVVVGAFILLSRHH
jgi:hypothetical protein